MARAAVGSAGRAGRMPPGEASAGDREPVGANKGGGGRARSGAGGGPGAR